MTTFYQAKRAFLLMSLCLVFLSCTQKKASTQKSAVRASSDSTSSSSSTPSTSSGSNPSSTSSSSNSIFITNTASTTACVITLDACPKQSTNSSRFKDTAGTSAINKAACLKRASDWGKWCGTTSYAYAVTAQFEQNGTYVAKKVYSVEKNTAPTTYECSEAGIRSAINAKVTSMNCNNKMISVASTIYLPSDNFKLTAYGAKFEWTGAGACNQDEGGSSLFTITGNNNILEGFEIIGVPDGIHVTSGNGNILRNLTFNKVCEDAITLGGIMATSATSSIIQGCTFKNASDKTIQVNGGTGCIVGNKFYTIGKALATGGSTTRSFGGKVYNPQAKTLYISGNSISDCKIGGIRASGASNAKAYIMIRNNTFTRCDEKYIQQDYGTITTNIKDLLSCQNVVKALGY